MHVVLSFYGSRGDVQPGVCLALELMSRGHRVTLAVPPNYLEFARSLGIDARSFGMDSEEHLRQGRTRAALDTGNPIRKLRLAQAQLREGSAAFDSGLIATMTETHAQQPIDIIVSGPLGQERVYALAEHLGTAVATMRFCAMSENGVIGAVPTTRALPAELNRRSWRLAEETTWLAIRGSENRFRARLGLSLVRTRLPVRLRERGTTQIQAYDEAVFPGLAAEWGATRPLVGFLDLPAHTRSDLAEDTGGDSDLMRWIDAGAPPVFISFGSVPVPHPARVFDAIVAASAAHGVRVVFGTGTRPEGVDAEHRQIYVAGRIDHSVVLPRCRAAVHHGGAGTTAAGLRAGLPTMVCALGADQLYWGAQIVRLGLGTRIRLSQVNAVRLTAGLATLLAPETAAAAASIRASLIDPATAAANAANAIESATGHR